MPPPLQSLARAAGSGVWTTACTRAETAHSEHSQTHVAALSRTAAAMDPRHQLIAVSPLIGSWAEQPMDQRLSIIQQQAAAAAARQKAQPRTAVASVGQASSSSAAVFAPPPASAAAPPMPGVDAHGEAYHARYIDPNKVISAATAGGASSSSALGQPVGGWGQDGQAQGDGARCVRACIRVGWTPLADHEQLCAEVMSAPPAAASRSASSSTDTPTPRSSRISGHSCPTRRPKEKRKREASERGRGRRRRRREERTMTATMLLPPSPHPSPPPASPATAVRRSCAS